MKLTNETLAVLKNFANINPGIEFKKGKSLTTISSTKTVLAKASVKDEFTDDFCIYDLNQFLSVHSLNKDVELEFDSLNVIFKNKHSKIKYRKTAKNMIVTPPEKELTLPSVDVEFTLTEDDLSSILKSASVLQSPSIAIESDGEKISITSFDPKDNSSHTNSTEISDGNGKKFKAVFLTENFKMLPGSYSVQLCSKGLSSFKNTKEDIQYWIAIESKDSDLSFSGV
jgi:hypothetical protein